MGGLRRGGGWLLVLAVLIVAAVVVPYTLLAGVERVVAATVFWTAFGALAIAVILCLLRGWRV